MSGALTGPGAQEGPRRGGSYLSLHGKADGEGKQNPVCPLAIWRGKVLEKEGKGWWWTFACVTRLE